jgi:hypothetical protein
LFGNQRAVFEDWRQPISLGNYFEAPLEKVWHQDSKRLRACRPFSLYRLPFLLLDEVCPLVCL